MDYKVLARKWRPKVFAEVAGQSAVLQALQYALKSGKIHHAYLFTGTRGVGKTTIARILAKALSCEQGVTAEPCNICANCKAIDEGKYIDVLEIDAASRTKVEDTRELLDNVPYAPVIGRYKIYIIDEVHMLSNHSFNALLKTLEEPPPHVKFLFATTEPQKLPITILSRCLQFQLSSFGADELLQYLQGILAAEKISFELEALRKISVAANGSVRDALTLLEQVISLGKEKITDTVVLQILGIANYELIIQLLTSVMAGEPQKTFSIIEKLKQESVDFNKVLQELLVMIHKIAVVQVLPNYLEESDLWRDKLLALAESTAPEYIQLFYQIGINGKKDLAYAPDLTIGFEMIMLRMIAFQPIHYGINPVHHDVNPMHHDVTSVRHDVIPEKASASQSFVCCHPREGGDPENRNIEINSCLSPVCKKGEKVNASLTNAENQELDSRLRGNDKEKISEQALQKPTHPNWEELIYEMKLIGLTKAIAQHCIITSWKQDKVILTLDPVHKASLQPHHEEKLQDALQKHFGYAIQVKINLGQVLDETPALKQQHKQTKVQQEAEMLVRDNKHVQEILDTFNAKLERVVVRDEA